MRLRSTTLATLAIVTLTACSIGELFGGGNAEAEPGPVFQAPPSELAPLPAAISLPCSTVRPSVASDGGDIDGDGDQDLVVVSDMGGVELSILAMINNGSGRYTQREVTRLPGLRETDLLEAYPRTVTLSDVDGDRDVDIVVGGLQPGGSSYNFSILLNNGQGAFAPAS